ncbi:uncharacterized protein [Rutidosis leptorrhynchoides]|uniref:uncharacterized protein n=1 Tax=Rutidosis leptorrhynchoides TaxID=125765 RepID=UPI003A99BBB0
MNVLSLNICGSKHRSKRDWVKELCLKHNIHFVGLQETKMHRFEHFRIKFIWGNYNYDFTCSFSQGHSGGIISIWDPWWHRSYLIVKGKWCSCDDYFFMVNVYASQDPREKAAIWSALRDFMDVHQGVYMLLGDFNVVRDESERFGSIFSEEEACVLKFFLDTACLVDLPIGGRAFTWMNTP